MLLKLLRSWRNRPGSHGFQEHDLFPEQSAARLARAHGQAPTGLHREILYRSLSIGSLPLNEVVDRCLADSGARLSPAKALHRPLASFFLSQYFLHALQLEGAHAECGVFAGTSALLLCRTAATLNAAYTGAGLHLVDSFQGLSEPSAQDAFAAPEADGMRPSRSSWHAGGFAMPETQARRALRDFPDVAFHAGWIPRILDDLPATRWSFVHLDVDLYAPTLDCLDYFFPRLCAGGVIICDDYGAPLFPGAHRAWDRYCDEHAVPYVVLDTGQSVILKT